MVTHDILPVNAKACRIRATIDDQVIRVVQDWPGTNGSRRIIAGRALRKPLAPGHFEVFKLRLKGR
jgi:hypothetical protein